MISGRGPGEELFREINIELNRLRAEGWELRSTTLSWTFNEKKPKRRLNWIKSKPRDQWWEQIWRKRNWPTAILMWELLVQTKIYMFDIVFVVCLRTTLATLAEEVCQRGTPWSLELKHSGNQVGWAGSAWQLLEPPAGISVRRVHTSASQSPAGSFGSNNPTIFKNLALTCFLITLGIKILAMTSTTITPQANTITPVCLIPEKEEQEEESRILGVGLEWFVATETQSALIKQNTIKDGGCTATHSKAIRGLDWILL